MVIPITIFVLLTVSVFLFGMLFLRGGDPIDVASQASLKPPRVLTVLANLLPATDNTKSRQRAELMRAGFYRRHTYESFAATRNVAVLLWVLFVAVLLVMDRRFGLLGATKSLTIGGVGLLVIYSLPGVVLSGLSTARKSRIYKSLPDALDMMTMMMTGGLGLNRSLERTSKELKHAHPDLAKELSIVHRQAQVGSFGKSMHGFADRMDDPEITGLSTLIQHSERLGSPIGDALVEYADGIRLSRRQRAEEVGNKRNVLLLFPVILLLAPPVYILLLGPAMLELREFLNRERRESGVLRQSAMTTDAPARILANRDTGTLAQ